MEFIDNAWYILHFSCTKRVFRTCASYQVDPNDQNVGLGHWSENDFANQNNQSTQVVSIQTTNLTKHWAQAPAASDSESEQNQTTWGPDTTEQVSEDLAIAEPGLLNKVLAVTLDPIVSLQGPLPLDPPIQPTMSVNVTTTTPANIPPNGGMCGVPLTIFDSTQSRADDFWGQFQRFKLVNCTHEAMKIPFDRVLTALTYMRGPLINDWVDQQEKKLADRIDMSKRNWVREDNETLWSEFEMAFLTAWTDTLKKQNAYDQLMRLTMSGWDVDTYITTFD